MCVGGHESSLHLTVEAYLWKCFDYDDGHENARLMALRQVIASAFNAVVFNGQGQRPSHKHFCIGAQVVAPAP